MARYKKRADGRYAKQVTIGKKDGKPIKKTIYGNTIKELEIKYRELMVLVDKGIILDNERITVTELYKEWYRIKKEGKVRANTAAQYKTISSHIIDKIGDSLVKDISTYTIESTISDFESIGKKRTAELMLQTTNAMMEYAVRNNIIAKNPCKELSVDCRAKEKRALTQEEKDSMDANIDKVKPRQKMIFLILRYTGMRIGEALALTKDDIDMENMIITINKTLVSCGTPFIQEYTKTKSGERKVPIFLPLIKPLTDYINNLDGDYLFTTKYGKFVRTGQLSVWIKQLRECVNLGDDITSHSFRHNFISECYSAGVDVKVLQSWVGHTDISTTLNIYTHLANEEIKKSDKMNDFYSSQKQVKNKSDENPQPLKLVK